ncbi:MAG: DUF3999 family protein [Chitinophagaceae bacterium]|nr:DUF3999 family protein [Chitinophagaceae bacterium]
MWDKEVKLPPSLFWVSFFYWFHFFIKKSRDFSPMMTITRLRLTYKLSVFFSLCALQLSAQEFSHKAKINPVPKSGFYRIPLSSNLAGLAQAQWDDLRMFDANGKEVPYIIKRESTFVNNEDYTAMNVASQETLNQVQTLVIENPEKKKINQLLLDMQNAETDRSIRISGSNDKVNWFSISDSLNFSVWGNANETTLRKAIQFPKSNYAFFKLEIKQGYKEPLNITQIGYSFDTLHKPQYVRVNNLSYSRNEIGQTTKLNFTFQGRNRVDQLVFYIREPKQYQREVIIKNQAYRPIGKIYTLERSKHQRRAEYLNENQLILSSSTGGALSTQYILGELHHEKFTLEIQNKNDPPLPIDSIVGYQLNTYIVAELKAEAPYFIYVGDSTLNSPTYDLVYFENNIPHQLPDAQVNEPIKKVEPIDGENKRQNERYLIGGAMVLLALFLLFITKNLMKKINN